MWTPFDINLINYWLIDLFIYLFTQTCLKKATQIIATEDEQDSQAPCALIAALIA